MVIDASDASACRSSAGAPGVSGENWIASGGVSTLEDLRALKAEEHTGIEGVIVGRALYDGRIDIDEALALLGGTARC